MRAEPRLVLNGRWRSVDATAGSAEPTKPRDAQQLLSAQHVCEGEGAAHRRQIASLMLDAAAPQAKDKVLAKQTGRKVEAAEPETKVRFQTRGLRSMRAKLGLSAAELATLLGVSQQSAYNWEHEKAAPRQSQITVIASLRAMGNKEARSRLVVSDTPKARH